jgi:thioredoxin reductase (NADPH)
MEKYQCLIVGSGPAGLSTAIYTARAGLKTMVLGCEPKVAGDYQIDNYFGFTEPISGRELIERGRAQAGRFGAVMTCDQVLNLHQEEDGAFTARTASFNEYQALTLILATGVSRSRAPIPDLEKYEGRGVSYCVSCDGYFNRGKPVLVAGEGLFAANQALELTNYTADIQICTLGKPLAIAQEYQDRLAQAGITVTQAGIAALEGEPGLSAVVLTDGTRREIQGLFIAVGEAGSRDFSYTLGVARNGNFIDVDKEMKTNIPGVFAAGDCTGGFMQISVAVGQGAQAAKSAMAYVKALGQAKP